MHGTKCQEDKENLMCAHPRMRSWVIFVNNRKTFGHLSSCVCVCVCVCKILECPWNITVEYGMILS